MINVALISSTAVARNIASLWLKIAEIERVPNSKWKLSQAHTDTHTHTVWKTGSFTGQHLHFRLPKSKVPLLLLRWLQWLRWLSACCHFADCISDKSWPTFVPLHNQNISHAHTQISRAKLCRCVCVFVYDIYISYFVRIHVNCIKNNHKLPEQMPQCETCAWTGQVLEGEREREGRGR